jgi:hypothetical protein
MSNADRDENTNKSGTGNSTSSIDAHAPGERTPSQSAAPREGSPTLTFRGGGWIIALSGVLIALLLGWSLLPVILGHRPLGDGRSVESYGFDLSTVLIDRATLVGSGNPRGFLPSLDDPKHLRGSEMLVYNEQNRPKYVVPTDRVLGIVIDGKAHAWPLSLMNVHEVVNDTVAGRAVLATYSPLCDTAMVFDRTIDGEVRHFEVSGLLYDSNLTFSEKGVRAANAAASGAVVSSAQHATSLFSQLESRAIAGPLARDGVVLAPLPNVCITSWSDWLSRHPTTTVTLRDPTMIRRMKEISYAHYFLSSHFQAPFEPKPNEEELAQLGLRPKSPLIAIRSDSGGAWTLLAIERLAGSRLGQDRTVRRTIDGVEYLVTIPVGPAVARVERADGAPIVAVPILAFAATAILAERDGVRFHQD